jgi:hypothetical protein
MPEVKSFAEHVLLFLMYGSGSAVDVLKNSFSMRQRIRLKVTVMASVGRFSVNLCNQYNFFLMI